MISEYCSYKGKAYPQGSEVCENELCVLCTEGRFEVPAEQSLNEEDSLVDPGEAYFSHVLE